MRAPVQVGADADWVKVGCSQSTTCARKRNGTPVVLGRAAERRAGDRRRRAAALACPGADLSDWSEATVGTFHTCGLRPGGEILVRGPQHRRPDRRARFRRRAPNMMRADPPTAGSKSAPVAFHLRAQGRRFRLVHGPKRRPPAGGRHGDARSQRDDAPDPRALRRAPRYSSSDSAASSSHSSIAFCRRSSSARKASNGARSPSMNLMRAAGYASARAFNIAS